MSGQNSVVDNSQNSVNKNLNDRCETLEKLVKSLWSYLLNVERVHGETIQFIQAIPGISGLTGVDARNGLSVNNNNERSLKE